KVLPLRHASGGAQPAHVDRFLQGHRQAEQRRVLAAGPPRVSRFGVAPRALEVGLDDGAELGIVPLDPPAVQIEELDGGDRPRAERGEHVGGGREGIDAITHMGPLPRSADITAAIRQGQGVVPSPARFAVVSSAVSTARSAGRGARSRRRTIPIRRWSAGRSGIRLSAPAFTSAFTAISETIERPSPAPTSFLVASALPSSIATRGVARPRRNQSSTTRRMVPPRS